MISVTFAYGLFTTLSACRLAATLAYMNPDFASTYAQLVALASAGGAAGYLISTRVGPTELPQAVRVQGL